MGDVTTLPQDFSTVLGDVYINADGSFNWLAATLTLGVVYLLFAGPRVKVHRK